jgi:hypothetical protein
VARGDSASDGDGAQIGMSVHDSVPAPISQGGQHHKIFQRGPASA